MSHGHIHPAADLDLLPSSQGRSSAPRLRYSWSRLLEHLGVVLVSLAFVCLVLGESLYSRSWGGVLLVLGTLALILGFRRSRVEEREFLEADRIRLLRLMRESLVEWANGARKEGDELSDFLATSLDQLSSLPDEALSKVARDQFPAEAASRLENLNHKGQREGLTASEEDERDELLSGYEQVMLLRAEAARLLDHRGHDVSALHDGE